MHAILLTLTKGAMLLPVETALGLMISFVIPVVTIISDILALVLNNKNNRS